MVLHKLTHLMGIDDEDWDAPGKISEKIEKLVITKKKQSRITNYF